MNFWIKLSLFLLSLGVSSSLYARPKFELTTLKVGKYSISVEVAKTEEQRSYGLMKISTLPKNSEGMFFIFERERTLSFWMKNTYMPLSIAFVNSKMKITNILKMEPVSMLTKDSKLKHYQSSAPAIYALEMPQNWFLKNGIKAGDKIEFSAK